ncbi:MAG: family 1 glycosylhydrolase [Actinomycetota bacterium]
MTLEMWAGVECTVNRVGDRYFDQLKRSGHDRRLEDLDLFAELGIEAIRYPVLWERTAPNSLETADWHWADRRLGRLREQGIRPIVGLVHHGSGPRHTSLIDRTFPQQLARFAGAVAQRYPWIADYTPVNEPLTTARFSGLYGHWYPHGRDAKTFVEALLNQCRAIAMSMQAIRRVNPTARLIQTDDLGKIFSTPLLAYQAQFENERRWLSFDLLCGRVHQGHPMSPYLRGLGVSQAELDWFVEHPCPPDIIGINHYLTSDRFLDERTERYPGVSIGGNHRHHYVDVEAVRVCDSRLAGPRLALQEAWERYHLPIAITEAHLGCTREEQLRWLKEIWDIAQGLQDRGVDIRAVTAWSLLGAYDWNSLVTRQAGFYESGVFDLRGSRPRPTALAWMVKELARGRTPQHPLLQAPGWWHRSDRLLVKEEGRVNEMSTEVVMNDSPVPVVGSQLLPSPDNRPQSGKQVLAIIGARGTLGSAFARLCDRRGIPYRLLSRQDLDITDRTSVDAVFNELNPWAVVNAAGYVRVDDAERFPEECRRVNADGPAILAAVCARRDLSLLTFSSDLVFDGTRATPYTENSTVAPLNVYGRTKAEAEARVLASLPSSLIVRTSAFFGPWDEYNFITVALRQLAAGETFVAAEDAIVSPTYVPDLVNASLDLLIDGEFGVWHVANDGAIAWAELARQAAEMAGVKTGRVEARPLCELGFVAKRPSYSVLGSDRGAFLPHLERAIACYLQDRQLSHFGNR